MLPRTTEKLSAAFGLLLVVTGAAIFFYGIHRRGWRGTGVSLFGLGLFWVLAVAFRWWPLPPERSPHGGASDDCSPRHR